MAFQLIDLENWERREFYEHFIKDVVCTSNVFLGLLNHVLVEKSRRMCPEQKLRDNSFPRGEGGSEGVGRGMRAITFNELEFKDLLQGWIQDSASG